MTVDEALAAAVQRTVEAVAARDWAAAAQAATVVTALNGPVGSDQQEQDAPAGPKWREDAWTG